MNGKFKNLKRERYPIPPFVRKALKEQNLMECYKERAAYQQNDYIGWINQAKMEATKEKRLNQMLSELRQGGVYMKMKHPASAKERSK
ncbi:MAG: YdeI/OmpD-associated family protein [Pseudomonadales bacterium]